MIGRRSRRARIEPNSFAGHLEELRRRLTVTAIVLCAGLMLGWAFQGPITRLLIRPLGDKLYYSSPTGGLDFIMSLSISLGIILALPVAVYNLLKFVEPAGTIRLARRGLRLLVISFLLASAGVAFAYFVSLPSALHFLKSFDALNVTPLIAAREYLTFVMTYLVAFAVIFQLPLIISFIDRIKPIKPSKLFKKQRWVIVASFVIAAFATPTPDPMNQTIMALPLIILFNISIVVVIVQHALTRKQHLRSPVHIHTTLHAENIVLQTVPVRVEPKPVLAPMQVETVERSSFMGHLPNFRHITDPTLLTVRDAMTGRAKPLMCDVIMPTARRQQAS